MEHVADYITDRKVVPFQDLPLAGRDRAWDASAARKRMARWASSDGSGDKDTIDWSKYRKGFLWYDEEAPENFGSYKLPIADVIDGRLYAIPRGIFAAAAVMQGARGGADIPEEDVPAVKRHIERYYAKMRKEFDDDSLVPPWKKNQGVSLGKVIYRDIGRSDRVQFRESSDGQHTVVVINTDSLDRHGTIIDPDGLDVEAFLRNPVVLWNHRTDVPPIARAVELKKKNGSWIAKLEWDEADSFASEIRRKVRQGFLNAASVGIVPREVRQNEDGDTWTITKSELVEFSIVSTPSNPDALVQQRSIETERLADSIAERLEGIIRTIIHETLSHAAGDVRTGNAPADSAPQDGAASEEAPSVRQLSTDELRAILAEELKRRLGKA